MSIGSWNEKNRGGWLMFCAHILANKSFTIRTCIHLMYSALRFWAKRGLAECKWFCIMMCNACWVKRMGFIRINEWYTIEKEKNIIYIFIVSQIKKINVVCNPIMIYMQRICMWFQKINYMENCEAYMFGALKSLLYRLWRTVFAENILVSC